MSVDAVLKHSFIIYNCRIGKARAASEEDWLGEKIVGGHDECDFEVGDVANRGPTMLAW